MSNIDLHFDCLLHNKVVSIVRLPEGTMEKAVRMHRLKEDYERIAAYYEAFPVQEFMTLLSKPDTAAVIDLNRLFYKGEVDFELKKLIDNAVIQ